jgi:hypothetical protein
MIMEQRERSSLEQADIDKMIRRAQGNTISPRIDPQLNPIRTERSQELPGKHNKHQVNAFLLKQQPTI